MDTVNLAPHSIVGEFLQQHPIYSRFEGFFVAGRHPIIETGILLLSSKAEGQVKMSWTKMQEHFVKLEIGAPDRIEQMLLWKRFSQHYAQDPLFQAGGEEAFEKDAYWSGEEYEFDRGYAWYQYFGRGGSDGWGKDAELFGRGVRTLDLAKGG